MAFPTDQLPRRYRIDENGQHVLVGLSVEETFEFETLEDIPPWMVLTIDPAYFRLTGGMYILSTGCQWRAIPKDLPPRSSVYNYFDLWTYDGTLERIHHTLYEQCREREQREASPTAAIIDSQSVKSAKKGGRSLIRTGTMRARRSRARSGTFLSTH